MTNPVLTILAFAIYMAWSQSTAFPAAFCVILTPRVPSWFQLVRGQTEEHQYKSVTEIAQDVIDWEGAITGQRF